MRLATYSTGVGVERLGAVLSGDRLLDLAAAAPDAPAFASMLDLIGAGDAGLARAKAVAAAVEAADGAATAGGGSVVLPLASVRLRAPIPRPAKNVFCVGLNYRSHVEMNAAALGIEPEIPPVPLFFSKPPTTVIGSGDAIHLDDRITQKLDYEVELGVVIGRGGTWIQEAAALDHVFGFTLVDEVSARDVQWRTSQMFIGKGLDTYCPIGPWILTADEIDGSDIELTCRVNGEVRQHDSTRQLIFGLPRIIAELSKGLTLEPGDIISTGTPGGCGYQLTPPRFLAPGDVVECSAPALGRLVNPVIAWPQPSEHAEGMA
jgi:2-keto-4-pentenoate hydratase/2-oxohepta-3-ene-1,7-dioic acid hydratase in catechol pathway